MERENKVLRTKVFISFILLIALLPNLSTLAQKKYVVDKGDIAFASHAELEIIKAYSNELKGKIDVATNQFAFRVTIKSFQGFNSSLQREMWRTAAAMELIPATNRIQLGDALLKQAKTDGFHDTVLWCLGRLGARQLFHGPANQVLAASVAARWIEALAKVPKAEDALVSLARRTGDPVRDVPAASFALARGRLTDAGTIAQLEGETERDERSLGRIFGEDLPSGLVMVS